MENGPLKPSGALDGLEAEIVAFLGNIGEESSQPSIVLQGFHPRADVFAEIFTHVLLVSCRP